MPQLGRALIAAGVILAEVGGVLLLAPKIPWLGKLPGDLRFQRGNTEVFIPLATSFLISAVVSALLWMVNWFRDKN